MQPMSTLSSKTHTRCAMQGNGWCIATAVILLAAKGVSGGRCQSSGARPVWRADAASPYLTCFKLSAYTSAQKRAVKEAYLSACATATEVLTHPLTKHANLNPSSYQSRATAALQATCELLSSSQVHAFSL